MLLADTPIRLRVTAAGLIPLIAFVYLAASDITDAVRQRTEAIRISTVGKTMPLVSNLIDALQRERGLSVLAIAANTDEARRNVALQREKIDRALGALKARIAPLEAGDVGQSAFDALRGALDVEKNLTAARQGVDRHTLAEPQVLSAYNRIIGDISKVIYRTVAALSNSHIARDLTALVALTEAKDRAGLERALGAQGFATPQFSTDVYRDFVRFRGEQDGYLKLAAEYSNGPARESLLRLAEAAETKQVEEWRDLAHRALSSPETGSATAALWFDKASARIALLAEAEGQIAGQLVADAGSTVGTEDGHVRTLTVLILVLLTTVGAALFKIIRSITTPIFALVADAIRLAGGDSSITFETIKRKDEIGMVARAVAKFRDNVKREEQLRNEFIATVSHELRTPLTAITGSVTLLDAGAFGILPAPVRRLLSVAQANCRRLVRIVNDILDIEKIDSGKMVYDRQPIEVRPLVTQAIEASRPIATDLGVTILLDPAAVDGVVIADPLRLTQVITNLLSNAIKFSARDSAVLVTIGIGGEAIRVSVRDRGPGIPEAHKDRVFDKFVQVDATDRRAKGGTGLGLSIARQIMTALGGKIGFEDAPGGGTVFSIMLPVAGACEDGARSGSAPEVQLVGA
jgi:signal transduction histidine kinase